MISERVMLGDNFAEKASQEIKKSEQEKDNNYNKGNGIIF